MARDTEWTFWASERFVATLKESNPVHPDRRLVAIYTELRVNKKNIIFLVNSVSYKVRNGKRIVMFN
jgi:hypothetical protein